jgi:hypothetical protein
MTDDTKRRLEILKAAVQEYKDMIEQAERELPMVLGEIDQILVGVEYDSRRKRYVNKENTDAE